MTSDRDRAEDADVAALSDDSATDHLLTALTVALEHLGGGSSVADRKAALRTSFVNARQGLRARKALLLYVSSAVPLELEILESSGLTTEQEQACRRLESCDGVSPSVIRQVIERLDPVWIPNAQERGPADQTRSLSVGSHSVLCAPILEPLTSTVLAVLYFQNHGAYSAFQQKHLKWLSSYAMALSHGFGLQLSNERRIQELSTRLKSVSKAAAPEIVGESAATRRLREVIEQTLIPEVVDRNPKPILILGPTGTGKEVIARYLHYYSTRAKGPFIALNCAGLTSGNATKSALFGHVRGAFTDAYRDEPGAFRAANKGILFLDEIGEMPLDGQAELLRVIQERRVMPLGSTQAVPIDVQIVAATNKDIPAAVAAGKFRDDLYYRINVHTIRLGPLASAARAEDVRPLLIFMLGRSEREAQKKIGGLEPGATHVLLNYTWPGNVRELESACTKLVTYTAPGAWVTTADLEQLLPEVFSHAREDLIAHDDVAYEEAFRIWEREFLKARVERFRGSKNAVRDAAVSLRVDETTLRRRLKNSGLPSHGYD